MDGRVTDADKAFTSWLLQHGAAFPKLQWPVHLLIPSPTTLLDLRAHHAHVLRVQATLELRRRVDHAFLPPFGAAPASTLACAFERHDSLPQVWEWPGQPHDGERGVMATEDIAPGEEMFRCRPPLVPKDFTPPI